MTVDAIFDEVEILLAKPKGREKVLQLNRLSKLLLARVNEVRQFLRFIRKRPDTMFYVNVSSAVRDPLELSVRIAGLEVGTVTLRSRESRSFSPSSDHQHFRAGWTSGEGSLAWDHPLVRRYLDHARDVVETQFAHREAPVEAALLRAMAVSRRVDKQQPLHYHQPVRFPPTRGVPLQFPLPIRASKGAPELAAGNACGHVDVLSRFGKGSGFRVFEVKKPDLREIGAVLQQAVSYCAAIRHMLAQQGAAGDKFWTLFGKGPRRGGRLEAVAFVEDGPRVQASLEREARGLNSANHHGIGLMAMFYCWRSVNGRRELEVVRVERYLAS